MEEKILNLIKGLKSWDEIKQFEENARKRDRLSEEVVMALTRRSSELGTDLVYERTKLNPIECTLAEKKIMQVVGEYVALVNLQGKFPQRTLKQLNDRGLIQSAEISVCKTNPTKGFQNLVDANLEDLSYERIIVEHPEEFSKRAVWFARNKLGLQNETVSPPASADSQTQERTEKLVAWLISRSQENDGIIPIYTHSDAAVAMGIGDVQKFGRVHGNIQSRLDFACYLSNLPPLGLVADAPFERAWGSDQRSWKFPVRAMQFAAQAKKWSKEDFALVLEKTESLPGQAHLSWKEELVINETAVQNWAYSFGAETDIEKPAFEKVKKARNEDWTRDELILALDLYLRHRQKSLAKNSVEIIELSEFLNRMTLGYGSAAHATFRNPNGVYMKLMNFRRFDPTYIVEGKVGLSRGNKDEEVVWNTFANDIIYLEEVANAIRKTVYSDELSINSDDEPEITEAEEGKVLTRLHRYRERNRKLIDQFKKNARKKHGRLFCEACGFDFSERYGVVGEGIIEVHHTKPVHTLIDGDKTKLEDLSMLCANCHRIVHSSRRWMTIEEVRELILRTSVSFQAL